MGKTSGLGHNLWVSGYNISNDIQQYTIASPLQTIDTTGIDKSAMERIGGERDGTIDATCFFNPSNGAAGDAAHQRFSLLPTTDQLVTVACGTVLGNPAANLMSKELGYNGKRSQSGELTFDVNSVANAFGLEWGVQLTAGRRTDTTATNGTGVDMGPGSPPGFTGPANFGAQFYLHVFAFTGTNVTVKIQESADNGGTDPFADTTGGGFTAATGVTFQRIATASNQTVKRWLRAVTTGTFTSVTFAVVAVRNDISTVF